MFTELSMGQRFNQPHEVTIFTPDCMDNVIYDLIPDYEGQGMKISLINIEEQIVKGVDRVMNVRSGECCKKEVPDRFNAGAFPNLVPHGTGGVNVTVGTELKLVSGWVMRVFICEVAVGSIS